MAVRRTLLATIPPLFPMAACAHLPAGARGPNGDQVQDVGNYYGEMLAKEGEITLFLFDPDDRPTSARDASGTAIVLSRGKQRTLTLASRANGAALVAVADFQAVASLRVVVQIVARPGEPRVQARFTPADLGR